MVSVGSVHGGTRSNLIPGHALLQLQHAQLLPAVAAARAKHDAGALDAALGLLVAVGACWPSSPFGHGLAEHTYLVAIDLPGFGHSQRHDALLSPRATAEFVILAAGAFGLDHPHLVGTGTGTAAALFAAAAYPERLRSLVVGSGAAAVPLELGGLLKDWVEAPDPEEFGRADPRQLVASALAVLERYMLPDWVREDYLTSYQGNRFAGSIRYVRAYPAELPLLAGRGRGSALRCRSSPAHMTRWCHRPMPSSFISGYRQQARHR